jgi:hypothetical protein
MNPIITTITVCILKKNPKQALYKKSRENPNKKTGQTERLTKTNVEAPHFGRGTLLFFSQGLGRNIQAQPRKKLGSLGP